MQYNINFCYSYGTLTYNKSAGRKWKDISYSLVNKVWIVAKADFASKIESFSLQYLSKTCNSPYLYRIYGAFSDCLGTGL